MHELLQKLLDLVSLKREAEAQSLKPQATLVMDDEPKRFDEVCKWCSEHYYTEPCVIGLHWWAFPPNGVMAIPIGTASLLELTYERNSMG